VTHPLTSHNDRDLVVTVHGRVSVRDLVERYEHAITPDGGYTGTFAEWVKGFVDSWIEGMEDSLHGPAFDYQHLWEIAE
jgi:hypothetical protein